MPERPGGRARIAEFAKARGETVDTDATCAAKLFHFREAARQGLDLRPGVANVMARARGEGVALGFATTTCAATVDLMFDGLNGQVARSDFAFVGDGNLVSQSKPSSEIYRVALQSLGLTASDVVAIEDTPESAASPLAANIRCIGFPGEAALGRAFPPATAHVVDRLDWVFIRVLAHRAA